MLQAGCFLELRREERQEIRQEINKALADEFDEARKRIGAAAQEKEWETNRRLMQQLFGRAK